MPRGASFNAFETYMSCQLRHEAKDARPQGPFPFVTISRKSGAGGITVGAKLHEYLNENDPLAKSDLPWTIIDKDLVEKVIEEHSLPAKVARFLSEDKISEVSDILEELFGIHPSKWTLAHKTSQTILQLARMGHVILVGRGSNVVTRALPLGFHVRLVGSMDKRVEYMKDRYQVTTKQALKMIKSRDQGRRNYLKKYFGKDIDDPLHYDLVINTDHVSYTEAARIIGDAVLSLHALR